jgi:transcriptional regulator GlxA family with amidase domain
VLARAGLLNGVRATVYGDARAKLELERGGALYVDQHVVTDQGIVTAAGPRDAGAFAHAMMRLVQAAPPRPRAGAPARRIERNLRLTPEERLRQLMALQRFAAELWRAGRDASTAR